MTYLAYNWNLDFLTPFIHFAPPLLPASSNYQSVLCIYELGLCDFYFWETYARFMILQNAYDCGLYFMNNKADFVSLICYDIYNIFRYYSLENCLLLFIP